MSEQKNVSLHQKQAKTRPMIEDVIPEHLDGDRRKAALDFVAYLQENKMRFQWAATNAWKVLYKSKSVCHIRMGHAQNTRYARIGEWFLSVVGAFNDYADIFVGDKGKKFAWAHLGHCVRCNKVCSAVDAGVRALILGKEFDHVCRYYPNYFGMLNPDAEGIKYAKKCIEKRCQEFASGKAVR